MNHIGSPKIKNSLGEKYFNSIFFILLFVFSFVKSEASQGLNELELIGKYIFFDSRLSKSQNMSCATCHKPEVAFANNKAIHVGSNSDLSTGRNTPSISYVSQTPKFKYDTIEGNIVPVGGMFLDGRVDSLEELVIKPFTNPLEMGLLDNKQLINIIKERPYFKPLLKISKTGFNEEETILKSLQVAIVAYLASSDFNKFNSKFDMWLQKKVSLTAIEVQGFVVFEQVDKGNCAACHTVKMQHVNDRPLLTDFTYDNIGVPVNLVNPFYSNPSNINPIGKSYVDYGLGQSLRLKDQNYLGMFKVPSLRNVALTSPYMHNGSIKTLREVVEFYNSRDLASRWGKPEVPYNVNNVELGNLQLTENEIDALVAFMKTLTDNYYE